MTRPKPNRKQSKEPPRKGRFHHAAATARAAVDRVAGRQGFAEADVLLNWPDIAGSALADACQPVRVRYGHRAHGATLIVQTTSARAPEVEHLGPVIIERVNQFYGYRAIHRLHVTQSTGYGPRPSGFAEQQRPFAGQPAAEPVPPTAAEQREAEQMAEKIQSPGLRAALTRMGAHVLAESRRQTSDT